MGSEPDSHTTMSHAGRVRDTAVLEQFRAAMLARNIIPPEPILADGRLHRCDAAGPRGRGDAAYLLHLDGTPTGGMENWRDGRGWQTWRMDLGRPLSAAEREHLAAEGATATDVGLELSATSVVVRAAVEPSATL